MNNIFEKTGDDLILAGSFRNFAGADTQFGPSYPFFNLKVDESEIPMLQDLNINVKKWTDTETGDEIHFIKVNIGKYADIEIKKEGVSRKLECNEALNECVFLDRAQFGYTSVGVYPRPWHKGGRCGYSAYLSYLFAEVIPSDVDKARDAFDINTNTNAEEDVPF